MSVIANEIIVILVAEVGLSSRGVMMNTGIFIKMIETDMNHMRNSPNEFTVELLLTFSEN